MSVEIAVLLFWNFLSKIIPLPFADLFKLYNNLYSCHVLSCINSLLLFSVQYQMEMMRHLRRVNIDHLHVGWYQSTYFGGFINRALLDSQFNYQHSIEESVVLIYGKSEIP